MTERSRRILVTGLSTYWGGRLAQALEVDPEVEAIIGVDNRDPTRELERTEFVRVGAQHSLIRRIVQAAEIDTVVDTRLVVDSVTTSPRLAHENNVIGTMNIIAACSGDDTPVRKFVFKSSGHYYGCEQDDPAFFTEKMRRPHPARTAIERDIVEAEGAVSEFAERHPDRTVTIGRFANVLGPDVWTSHIGLLSLPAVPMIFGFDPRYQFVHEDDVVHALEHMVQNQLPGTFNVAADGVLALSEVIGLLGKWPLPVLPPWGTELLTGPLRRLGFRIPDEMLNQLRFGRGLDNRKFKAAGFNYQYTTREAVQKMGEYLRLSAILRGTSEPYRYEQEVEEFLRRSPHVRRQDENLGAMSHEELLGLGGELRERESPAESIEGRAVREEFERRAAVSEPRVAVEERQAPLEDYEELESEEVIALLGSLDRDELTSLERIEREGRSRDAVLDAIDRVLARQG
jgi:UDP-glucose 4-epimerase